jgi:hypothetical protein
MKKILVSLFLCMASMAYGQTDTVYVNRVAELNKMGKLSLTKTYVNLVEALMIVAPNIAFANSSQDVPSNRYTRKRWKNINGSSYHHLKNVRENYGDILPFADKQDLIKGILYLEKVLDEMSQMHPKN